VTGVVGGSRAEPWTLDRAVNTALKNSPDARIARQRIEAPRR
jgi:outer membrane protein TolC